MTRTWSDVARETREVYAAAASRMAEVVKNRSNIRRETIDSGFFQAWP